MSDRDPIIVSNFRRELFKLKGTQLKMSTVYHPQSDGQTKVINRCLETFLRCFIADQLKTWILWLPWAEYWYITTFHGSTGNTPFEVVYGRAPPIISRFLPGETKVKAVHHKLLDRDECLRQLKRHLLRAHNRMKNQADIHRQDQLYKVGEMVFLKPRPHVQKFVNSRICPKLSPHYYGPFSIVARVGAVAYRLSLPESSRIHPVFHVSLLKKAIGNATIFPNLPIDLEPASCTIWEPLAVLAKRDIIKSGENFTQVLIHWQDKPLEEATWEDAETIAH